jgi:hypothetical protein
VVIASTQFRAIRSRLVTFLAHVLLRERFWPLHPAKGRSQRTRRYRAVASQYLRVASRGTPERMRSGPGKGALERAFARRGAARGAVPICGSDSAMPHSIEATGSRPWMRGTGVPGGATYRVSGRRANCAAPNTACSTRNNTARHHDCQRCAAVYPTQRRGEPGPVRLGHDAADWVSRRVIAAAAM